MNSRGTVAGRIVVRRWGVLSLAVLASLLVTGFSAAWPQESPAWNEPTNLSQSSTASYYPDIAVDSAGRVYVVWGEYSEVFDGRPDMLMLRIWDGHAWSPANDIAVGGHLPQIAADSQGRLHLVRIANGLVYKRAWVQDDPLNAQNWTPEHAIAGSDAYWPDMMVDHQDRVHLVFSGEDGINHVRSADGGDSWTEPARISLHSDVADTPRLAVDHLGNVYAVWQILDSSFRGQNPMAVAIGFSRSVDGGQTWLPPVEVAAGAGGFEWPQVAVDSKDTIHVVWHPREPQSVGYAQSLDGGESWTPVEVLDLPAGGAYSHDLEVDSADNLHLVMSMALEDMPLNPAHLVRPENGSWSAPVPIARNPCEGASADVEVVLDQGNRLHAVWYDVEDCLLGWVPPSGRGEVFYSDFVADAPTISSKPPSRSPVPTGTAHAGRPAPSVAPAYSTGAAPTSSPGGARLRNLAREDGLPMNGLLVGIGLACAVMVIAASAVLLGKGRQSR